jgi:hypothetical protein
MKSIPLKNFTYNPKSKTLVIELSELRAVIGGDKFRWPEAIPVFSKSTGATVEFVPDVEAAKSAEYWDGEMYKYIPSDSSATDVCVWVLND